MPQPTEWPPRCRCGLDKFFDEAVRQWLCTARFDGKHAGYSQTPDPLQSK